VSYYISILIIKDERNSVNNDLDFTKKLLFWSLLVFLPSLSLMKKQKYKLNRNLRKIKDDKNFIILKFLFLNLTKFIDSAVDAKNF